MVKKTPTEHEEQAALVAWLLWEGITHAAVPNGFFTNKRDAKFYAQIKKLKDEGYSPGFPDLMIYKKKDILFIEMKNQDGGRVDEKQKEWHDILTDLGFNVEVCAGFEAAKKAVQAFMWGDL